LEKKQPVILKGVPVAGQAEKLVRVRREITRAEEMTRAEQIEFEAKQRTDELMEKARTEADRIVSAAKNEADSIRTNARNDGDLTAKREALEKLSGLISELENEINRLRVVRKDFLGNNIEGIMDFACGIAGKILVAEMTTRPEAIADRARNLLERMPPGIKVTLVSSPEDIDVIERYLQEAGGPADTLRTSLRSDPDLKQGCLRLESDSGCIEAGLLNTLEELGNILRDQARQFSGIAEQRTGEGDVD